MTGEHLCTTEADVKKEVARLYAELQGFRNKPDFLEWGLAVKSPYRPWHDSMVALVENPVATQAMIPYEVAPASLKTLAVEYVRHHGLDTELTQTIRDGIEAFIS